MSKLIAYNLTGAPVDLDAGNDPVTLLASAAPPSRSEGSNVTSELRGLSGGDYTLLQAQADAGSVEYRWDGAPAYDTGSLAIDFVRSPGAANRFVMRQGIIGVNGMVAADVASDNVFGGFDLEQDFRDLDAALKAAEGEGQLFVEWDGQFADDPSPTGTPGGGGGFGVLYIPPPLAGEAYKGSNVEWHNHGRSPTGNACRIEIADGAYFDEMPALKLQAGAVIYKGTTSPNGAPIKIVPSVTGNPSGNQIECGRFWLGNGGANALPMVSMDGGGGAAFLVVHAENEFFLSGLADWDAQAPIVEVINGQFSIINCIGPVAFHGNWLKSAVGTTVALRMASPACDGDNLAGGRAKQSMLFGGAPVVSKYQQAPAAPTSFAILGTEVTLNVVGEAFTGNMVGSSFVIDSATSPANDGTFVITSVIDAENVTYENAAGVSEAGAGTYTAPDIAAYISEGGNPEALGTVTWEMEWSSDRSTVQSLSGDGQLVLGRIGDVDTSGGAVVVTLPYGASGLRAGYAHDVWVDGANNVTFRAEEGDSANGTLEAGGNESDALFVGAHSNALFRCCLTAAGLWRVAKVA